MQFGTGVSAKGAICGVVCREGGVAYAELLQVHHPARSGYPNPLDPNPKP